MWSIVKKTANYLLCLLIFAIPIAWWARVNANYYTTKLTLLFLAGGLAWLVIPSRIYLPKFPKPLLFSLIAIVLFQVGFHTYALSLDDFLFLFKFLSFSALVLWFYSLNLDLENVYKKSTYAVFATLAIILGFSLFEFYQNRIINLSTDVNIFLGTFGNVNMYAEFFVLSLPFVFHWTRFKDNVPQWLKLSMLTCWIFFIFYCRSRSAWIGLVLWLLLQVYYKVSKRELLFMLLPFIFYIASQYLPSVPSKVPTVKDNSFHERVGLYEATVELIKDHPWGISVGRFMGEIEPYQMNSSTKPSEYNYFDQPHSEFLKWGAQFGWLFSGFALLFFFAIVFQLGKWFLVKKNSYLLESFAVLLPQMAFQFPFENPASLLYLSFVFALFFHQFVSKKLITVHLAFRPLTFILFLAGVYSGLAFLNSVYQESTFPKNENIVKACEYYPINVKACHAKLAYYLEKKQYDNFLKDFKTDFSKEPFFVDYLRLLPTYYSIKQNNKKTCESLYLYKTIFPKQIAFDNKYYEDCKTVPNLFYFEDPIKFKAKYLSWLDGLN